MEKAIVVTPADCQCGLADEIHAERDRTLEESCSGRPTRVSVMRKSFGPDARSRRQDAATLFNSLGRKFRFPLNQDMWRSTTEKVLPKTIQTPPRPGTRRPGGI